jgi:3-deoxy-manno-octulosonate cytidylyltransferase (CMP-KDO synthetase)
MSSPAIGIIPARYSSTRFPGKPLADIGGTSMVVRVVQQAMASSLSKVVVATDDHRIFRHVEEHGYEAVLTSSDHQSGTERCLEAYGLCGAEAAVIVNIQGDEPFIRPEQIDSLIRLMEKPGVDIGTLAIGIGNEELLRNPNKVKVVKDVQGRALYFSRNCIPYQQHAPAGRWTRSHRYFKHVGMYAYRASVLPQLCALPAGALEKAESLEQLRWLEYGYSIFVAETDFESPAVDTPEDLEMAVQFIQRSRE